MFGMTTCEGPASNDATMNLAFDIDDTITAKPELFAALSAAPGVL